MDTPQSTFTPEPVVTPKKSPLGLIVAAVVIVLAGSVLGYFLAPKSDSSVAGTSTTPAMIKSDTEVGSTDSKTFRDTAQGTIEKGGLGSEGTHKLIRTGGPSQTVYLTSSVIDLDEFVGKNVEVWGETVKAAKAGWLMDVGRVKLVQ